MISASRTSWARSQERAAAAAAARSVPTHAESKVLFYAAQLSHVCLQLSEADGSHGAVVTLQRLAAIDAAADCNAALLTALLLCMSCSEGVNSALGIWHAYRVLPGA